MARRELRRAVVRGALQLAEQINVEIEPNAYAVRYGTQGGYKFCILGALAYVTMSPRLLSEITLETVNRPESYLLEAEHLAGLGRSVRETGMADLFDFHKAPDFVHDVLTLLWDVEDVALIETAFMGEVVYHLGSRIALKSIVYNLWGFFHDGQSESILTSEGDRNLVGQFSYARTLRTSVPDDKRRYQRILQNVLEHDGLYNPRG
jgi:hypothetical protein